MEKSHLFSSSDGGYLKFYLGLQPKIVKSGIINWLEGDVNSSAHFLKPNTSGYNECVPEFVLGSHLSAFIRYYHWWLFILFKSCTSSLASAHAHLSHFFTLMKCDRRLGVRGSSNTRMSQLFLCFVRDAARWLSAGRALLSQYSYCCSLMLCVPFHWSQSA